MKKRRDNEFPLSSVSKSDSSDERFMQGVNNIELTKCLNEHVPKTMEEMMITTTAFIRGEAAAASKKKGVYQAHSFYKDTKGNSRDRSRKVSVAATYGDPVEKRSSNKFCDFHNDKGHNTDECMQLKKQVEELVRAGKLPHLIKEIKHGRDLSKVRKKETAAKDKPAEIYMIQSWQRITRQKVTKIFNRVREITFPPLTISCGAEGPLVIEAKIEGHMIYCIGTQRGWARPENFKVAQHPDFPDQEVAIGGTLSAKGRTKLCLLVKRDIYLFGKRKKGQDLKRAKAIQVEVQKLVEAWIMREVYYHDWLSNPVMKLTGKLNLSAATLSRVSWTLTKAIPDTVSDEEKMAFHTGQGVYCYTKMPFGLKNAGATYQRLVNNAFDSQNGQNIEVYIDDLVIKSHTKAKMLRDISETFRTLRKINMKLNPKNPRDFEVKEQVLADFLAEIPDESLPAASVVETQQESWTLFTDGSSCVDGSGVGLILTSPEGTEFTYALRFQFAASNNKAEYEALIAGLWIAAEIGVQNLHVLVEILKEISIQEKEVTTMVEEDGPTCMTQIMEYLKEGTLPGDRKEARKLRIKARQYELLEGVLYRRSFITSWLRCVGPLQAEYVIREIHEGSCNLYAGPRSMVVKDIRLGYYWLTLHWDAQDMIRLGKVKFFIVALDYFTKWIEAKAVVTITGIHVKKFVWDNIVCRFVKHLLSNGLIERENQSLGERIRAYLGEGNKNWVEELSHVLRAHRTMIKSSHVDTPFSLTYGTEAVISAKIRMPMYRTAAVDVVYNHEELLLNLDLLEERRERAAIRKAHAKLKMTKYYNARVRDVTFRPSDFVYRSNDASHAVDGGKL
nr:reverse transcriptase domain-containing protein [Tanacetum cinerariifolium]